MKGMRNTTLIAAMVLTLAAFGCSSTSNDTVVDNAPGTVQNDSPAIASNADANSGAATVPTSGVEADSRSTADNSANSRIGTATATNQMTPSVPSQGLTLPDNRSNTVATTQVAQSTTTYNTPITSPSTTSTTTVSGTSGISSTDRVDTTASVTMPETQTTTTTVTTTEERNLRETTDQSMASSAQTDDTTATTEETTTTRRRMRKD